MPKPSLLLVLLLPYAGIDAAPLPLSLSPSLSLSYTQTHADTPTLSLSSSHSLTCLLSHIREPILKQATRVGAAFYMCVK